MKLAQTILEVAHSQLGVEEIPRGSNSGPQVDAYLKSVGLGKGYAWCMSFVYWCTKEACLKAGATNLLKKTGGVLAQWNAKPELRVSTPQPGDIFIMDHGKGTGHTGFVSKVFPNGNIETIEGNTNDDGSREGYEVCRRIRTIKSCKGFLRADL